MAGAEIQTRGAVGVEVLVLAGVVDECGGSSDGPLHRGESAAGAGQQGHCQRLLPRGGGS